MLHGYFNITVIEEWITFFAALLLLNGSMEEVAIIQAPNGGYFIGRDYRLVFKYWRHQHENAIPFNGLMLLTDLFLIWFFAVSEWFKKGKRFFFISMGIFIGAFIMNLLSYQGLWTYNYYSETIADIFLFIICTALFYKLLQNDEYINLLSLDYFWLATGVLFSSLGSALLYQFSDILHQYFLRTGIDIGTYINFGLNSILYISLIISFVCRRKATRSLQVL